jgi:tRNA modification GTPase
VIRVGSKADLNRVRHDCDLAVSALTGEGMAALVGRLNDEASRLVDGGADAVVTRERHRLALERSSDAFHRAQTGLMAGHGLELATEDVRLGVRALGAVTGRVDVEQVLDRLFAGFCIGK